MNFKQELQLLTAKLLIATAVELSFLSAAAIGIVIWTVVGSGKIQILVVVLALAELVCYRGIHEYSFPAEPDATTLFADAAGVSYHPQRLWPWESSGLAHYRKSVSNIACYTDLNLLGLIFAATKQATRSFRA